MSLFSMGSRFVGSSSPSHFVVSDAVASMDVAEDGLGGGGGERGGAARYGSASI